MYDPSSADVHLLTGAARVLWTLVADEQPHAIEDLVSELATVAGSAPRDELARFTEEALASMDQVGLIRPIQS